MINQRAKLTDEQLADHNLYGKVNLNRQTMNEMAMTL